MAPQLEQECINPDSPLIHKVGGSIIFLPKSHRMDTEYVKHLLDYFKMLYTSGVSSINIIGGGQRARDAISDAKALGVTNQKELDEIGIGITVNNARTLKASLNAKEGIVALLAEDTTQHLDALAQFQGGKISGRTTDYVAVEAAIAHNQPIVFIMSNKPGLLEKKGNGELCEECLIPEITLSSYIEEFAQEFESGQHTPIDKLAAELALENNITIVLLGKNIENLDNCISGQEFIGTIVSPE